MSESDVNGAGAGLGPSTDISASELEVEAQDDRTETSDPDAYVDDGTLGGLGGSENTSGGAG